MQLKEFSKWLKEKGIKPITIKNYVSQINNFYNNYSDLKELPIYVSSKPYPIRKVAATKYLEFLKENNNNVDEIFEKLREIKTSQTERKEIQTLSLKEGGKLVKHLLKARKFEIAVACMIVYDTGVRIRAILRIKKKDIEKRGNEVYIDFIEKRGKKITRLITNETYKWIKKILKIDELDNDTYLFFGKKKISLDELNKKYYEFWSELKNESRKLFGVGVSWHWLRRGAGDQIYNATQRDIVATAEFLGHKDPKVTKIYLKLHAEKAKDVIKNVKREW